MRRSGEAGGYGIRDVVDGVAFLRGLSELDFGMTDCSFLKMLFPANPENSAEDAATSQEPQPDREVP